MSILPAHLKENERDAIWTLLRRLSDYLSKDFYGLWLFGSKARGDFTIDSDVDILIILDRLTPEKRGEIRRLAARISLNHDTLLNTHIYEKAEWDAIVQYQDTLWREVRRDGISLYKLVAQATN